MKVVIMAGGKGTRIASVVDDIPKPMIPIQGKPILEYQIESLKEQGITEIILVVGHLGKKIIEYFGDGSKWNVSIKYYIEEEPLGTAGALAYLVNDLTNDFLLLNGDIILEVDFLRMLQYHREKRAKATILTHPNNHPYDSGLIIADKEMKVVRWLHKEEERTIYKNRVNAGVHILGKEILRDMPFGEKVDLDRQILRALLEKGELYAYDSPEYVKDMGTPDRYQKVIKDVISGKYKRRSLRHKQKAIFLDRDGTINKYKGFINNAKDLELIEGVAEAIKQINESDYLAIVITNQPVIARGECSLEELEEIHNKMETLLGNQGAYIDDIFFCPHHPDKGFDGEISEYKIKCECRKPKPDLFKRAAKKYNISLSQSYMIGDHSRDIQAGKNAGCKESILITSDNISLSTGKHFNNLLDAVKKIVQGGN